MPDKPLSRARAAIAAAWARYWPILSSRPAAWAAAAAVVVAAACRLAFVNYGLPHIYFWDEPTVVNVARELIIDGRLCPGYFYNYPSLVIDLQAIVAVASYFQALGHLPAYTPFHLLPVNYFYLNARLVSVAFGVAAVLFVYLFGSRVWHKPWWGVIGAAFLAVINDAVTESRLVGVDVPLATLTIAAVYYLFRYGDGFRRRHFWASAVFLGAAMGAKYNGAVFLVPASAALWVWRRPAREWVLFMLTAGAVFLVTTPGALFRLNHFVDAVGIVYHQYKGLSGMGQAFTTTQVLKDLAISAWYGNLSPVPAVAVLLGIGVTAWWKRGRGLLFLLFPAAFLVAISGLRIAAARFIVDIFPFLALLFAAGLGGLLILVGRIPWRAARVALAVVATAAVFIPPAVTTARGLRAWSRPDTRDLAAAWVEDHVPWPAVVVKEAWNQLPLEQGGETDAPPLDQRQYKVVKTDWITRKTPEEWARVGAVYFTGHVPGPEYPIWTEGIAGAMDGAGGDLAGFWSHFEPVTAFRRDPRVVGQDTMRIYRLDDDLLAEYHPYRPVIGLKDCIAVKEAYPNARIRPSGGWIRMFGNARLGAYFTTPGGRYRLGLRLRGQPADGVPPRLRVYVDGAAVADFGVTRPGVYWTRPLDTGSRRYRHLLVAYYNDAVSRRGEDRLVAIGGLYVVAEE